MAGLACGLHLQNNGVPFTILEASDTVGGRVRTDVVDGFLLDRGFQIFLTSYPTAKELLDYDALDLKPFYAGKILLLAPLFCAASAIRTVTFSSISGSKVWWMEVPARM